MPKQGVFTLKGPYEGKTMVINDRYPFTDGVFKTPAHYAPLMARMLCEFYGAELTFEGSDDAEAHPDDGGDGSLAVAVTKGGPTEGQKMEAQDLAAKTAAALKIAGDEAALKDKRATEQAALDAAKPK